MNYIRLSISVVFIILADLLAGQDNTPPVIVTPARDTSFECGTYPNLINLLTQWYNNQAGATATDDSGTVTFEASLTLAETIGQFNNSLDVLCGNRQSVEVTFIAADPSGNMSPPTTATFFTTDITPPSTNTVPNVQYSCVAGIRDTLIRWIQQKAGYTATDLCSNAVQWTNFQYAISSGNTVLTSGGGSINNGPYPAVPDGICNWTMNINFFVRDECGNQTITPGTTSFSVMDDVAPVFVNPPADITISCSSNLPAPTIQATDYCTRNVTPVLTESNDQSSDVQSCGHYRYTITRTWTVSDLCGNTAAHTQRIFVTDNVPPSFTPQQEVLVSCKTFADHPDSVYLKSSDNCSMVFATFRDSMIASGCTTILHRTHTLKDACQNTTIYTQSVKVVQNIPPTITAPVVNKVYACTSIENFNAELVLWANEMAGSAAISSCGPIMSFAAIKNSYDIRDTTTYPGTFPTSFPAQSCPSSRPGYLRHVEVDFVYYDSCGNTVVQSAVFGITDNQTPVITSCPPAISLATDPSGCEARISVPVPASTDDCVESASPVIKKIRVEATSSTPPGPEAIIDPVTLRLGPFNPSTAVALQDATFDLRLISMDIDDVTEFFRIFDEDGALVATTPVGAGQCGSVDFSVTVNKTKINTWIQDGYIDFRFVPNIVAGSPVLAINNICGSSFIEGTISFEIDLINTIRRSYRIDGGLPVTLSSETTVAAILDKGQHQIQFEFSDCAGNLSVCVVDVNVRDTISPVLTCPGDITTILSQGACQDTVAIPMDLQVMENCDGIRKYNKVTPASAEASLLSFTFDESDGLYKARSKQLLFTEVFPMIHIDKAVILTIDFYGDNNEAHEYFDIFGPGGFLIGRTNVRASVDDCGMSNTTFQIDRNLFNNWIVNNQLSIVAVPANISHGINPCIPVSSGQSLDNLSYIRGRLIYSDATFSFSVSGATTLAKTDIIPGASFVPVILRGGTNRIQLNTSDGSGNTGTCSFNVIVNDSERPVARCKNAVVTLHPSGLIPAVVNPDMINNGSSDNCRIKSLKAEPPTLDCSDSNKDVTVLLIAEDDQGNTDTCSALIKVKSADLKPTFSSGLCSTDTLKLFANVPPASVQGTYTFHWVGPGNIEFFTENPSIPNADESLNGTYILTVTGFNNCTSVGSVIVNIKPLIKPELTANDRDICSGEEVILTTTNYSGNIEYQWYSGIAPTGILLKTTTIPEFIIKPNVGVHFYYVIAKGPDCSSNPSSLLRVTVQLKPDARVNNSFLSPCEGDEIVLGTMVSNSNFTYHWTGPAGYSESGQQPRIIRNVSIENAGDYRLIIKNGECISDTAITRVVVLESPAKPTIVSADIFCEGAIFTLIATSSANAEKYLWYRNGVLFTTTQENNLIIPNAQAALQATWTVKSSKGDCFSPVSAGKFVAIDNRLEIGVINSGPVCMGDSVQLQATFVPNATYRWSGPISNIPSVFDPKIKGVPGDYSVTITTPTGCQNNANTTVSVISIPEITALSNDAVACMSGSESIRFYASVFPPSDQYTYLWKGPNDFRSSSKTPVISNITEKDTGVYQLVIFNNGCPSNDLSTRVYFRLIPPAPDFAAAEYYCVGDTITLSATATLPGATYHWSTPLGRITTPDSRLVLSESTPSYSGQYSLEIQNYGCTSLPSPVKTIQVRPRPSIPFISGDTLVCYGDTIRLQTAALADTEYFWSGPSSFNNTAVQIIGPAASSNRGIYQVTAWKDGCRSLPSLPFEVEVRDEIKTPEFALSAISLCSTKLTGAEICLNTGTMHPDATYTVFHQSGQTILSGSSAACQLITNVNSLSPGSNFLYVRAVYNGCRSKESLPLVINVNNPPELKATAIEANIITCPDEGVRLISAFGPPLVSVKWTALLAGNIISDVNSVSPTISGLREGNNIVYLDYSVDGCPGFSRDTVMIFAEFKPLANTDEYTLTYGENGIFNVLLNDVYPPGVKISLVTPPKYGAVNITDNIMRYTPDNRFLEPVTLKYRICGDYCPDQCSEAEVRITFDDNIICKAPTIFTPNGDNINDYFIIPCLETGRFPANKVSIFNQWGNEVFYASPYRNDWAGTYAGNALPAGTYFYIVDTGDGQRPINGFLILQR